MAAVPQPPGRDRRALLRPMLAAWLFNPLVLPLGIVATDPSAWLDCGHLAEEEDDFMLADLCFGPPAAVLLVPMLVLPVLGWLLGRSWPFAPLALGAIFAALLAPVAAVVVFPIIRNHWQVMDVPWRIVVLVMFLQLLSTPFGAWVMWKAAMRRS